MKIYQLKHHIGYLPMNKVSSSIHRINYPCRFICKFSSTICSGTFFSNELIRKSILTFFNGLQKMYIGKKCQKPAILKFICLRDSWINLMSGVKLAEMINYEFFTCFISFCDQINLSIITTIIDDKSKKPSFIIHMLW